MLQYFQEAKNIQQKYTLEDFLFRWKKIQRVVQKQSLQGLLLITGQYALDSYQAAYLFNWLFLGLSGKNIYNNKYLHENFSQLIVLIHNEQSYIFLPPKAKSALEHLIYGIPNCKIFCPTENQYNNKEVLDTLKITFFYQMVENKKSFGVFLEEHLDAKYIEKWPLIQSYALEPVGKTFFTLQNKVLNLGSKISSLFKNLDKHSLKNLVSQTSFSLQGQIKGALNIIQLTDQKERGNINEKKIQQSMQEAVQISSLEPGIQKQTQLGNKVRVLFGENSSRSQESSQQVKVESKYHLTLEHFDPYTEFQVWRTYFLDTNLQFELEAKIKIEEQSESFLTKTSYVQQKSKNQNFLSQKILVSLYLSLVQGTIDAIAAVSKDYRNLNIDFLKENILSKINSTAKQLYGKTVFYPNHLEIFLESYDSFGNPRLIDFKDVVTFKLTSTFYVLKCKLNNVFGSDTTSNLGSLVFSESFLLQQGCYLLLSKNISYFDFWKCSKDKNQLLQNINPNFGFQSLGKSVFEGSLKNRVFVPLQKLSSYHFNIPMLQVKYYFHDKGIRIWNSKIGWKIIFYKDIQDLTLVNKIPGQWVLFRLKQPFLFESLESNVLFIQFRGKAFEILLKKINDKDDPLKLNYLQEIPPILSDNWYFTQQVLKKQLKKGALIHQGEILQSDFLWSFIEAKQLMILNMKDIKMNLFKALYQQRQQKKSTPPNSNNTKLQLILVTGTYGSNKLKIAQTISRFGPQTFKYSNFCISTQNLYSRIQPSVYLELLQEHMADNSINLNSNHLVIAVIPSWLDISKTIPLLTQKYYIRTVITKVNSNNFYSGKNKNLVENVLTFCLPGYVQNIILDTTAGDDESLISSISKILWVFNSEAKISRASNGIISTGQCNDLVKDETYHTEYNQFLRNKYSSFFKFDMLNSLSVNYLEFKLPIYDPNFTKKLTKTNGYLINYAAILDELESKKIQAENSKDQLMISLYQLQESITMLKRRQKVPLIREIKGVIHVNEEKDDKQFVWANKDYKEKLIEQNSKQKGFFILSQNYNQSEIRIFFESFSFKKILFEGILEKVTSESLSGQQIKEIEKQNRNKYLDNGDYFDGYFYRNIEGFILHQHPHLSQILAEWIQEKNKKIQNHNAQIMKEWEDYLKIYQNS